MKKNILQTGVLFIFIACLIFSCDCDEEQPIDDKTVNVTFLNESSYNIIIHRDSFDGFVLLELPASSKAQTIPVRISDNNVGTTFSIEYIWVIPIREEDNTIREVPVSGIDPNLQLPYLLKAGKSPPPVQIPNPENLEVRSAYMIFLNTYNLPCQLHHLGMLLPQADNNHYYISPGKTGIYKNRYPLPPEGELYQGYSVDTASKSVLVPDFIMKNGFIYKFMYDGTKVEKIGNGEDNIFIN
jgi:hypothetical protein